MAQNFDQAKCDNTFWPMPNILKGSVSILYFVASGVDSEDEDSGDSSDDDEEDRLGFCVLILLSYSQIFFHEKKLVQ